MHAIKTLWISSTNPTIIPCSFVYLNKITADPDQNVTRMDLENKSGDS